MVIKREGFGFTLFLGSLVALPALAINMGLPGFPLIEQSFENAVGRAPLTLSLFLLGFAISPVICGPIADWIGRRLTLIAGLVVFVTASLGCAFSPGFNILLAFCLLQGFSVGACVIMPLAVVRDVFQEDAARGRLSQIAAVLSVAPLIAPILGATIAAASGWRLVYAALALIGLVVMVTTLWGFEETLPRERRRSLKPAELLSSYGKVLGDRNFLIFTLIYALAYGSMFSFIAGSSAVMMGAMRLSGQTFSLLLAVTSCGLLAGSVGSARLAARNVGSKVVLNYGLALLCLAAIGVPVLAWTGALDVTALVVLVTVVMFCFGLTAPSANHEALRNLSDTAGAGSGVVNSLQMLVGAAASAVIALLQPLDAPALVTGVAMAFFAIAAASIYFVVIVGRRFRRELDGTT